MPLDGDLSDWGGPEDESPWPGYKGVYVVVPLLGVRGGSSRPYRWRVDEFDGWCWNPILSFLCRGGVREARIYGGFLLREHRYAPYYGTR
jgi:hypothetical protein